MTKVVYISYNSIHEPLVDSQVLTYLKGLAKKDFEFTLITAEVKSRIRSADKIKGELAKVGINWMPVYRGKLGVLGQLFAMRKLIIRMKGISFVHARSYFSGVVAYLVWRSVEIPYIYDIRGFWVEEKVYKGRLKPKSMVYKILKIIDQKVFQNASGVVSLTNKAKEIIIQFRFWKNKAPLIEVIPTCVNNKKFKPLKKSRINMVYLGSVGQGYMGDIIFKVFSLVQHHFKEVEITLISRSQTKLINHLAKTNNVDMEKVKHLSLTHEQVAQALGGCSIGLSFINPHFSKKASCATKIGEYMSCGMPVLCNTGIGDMDEVLSSNVAVFCDDFSSESLLSAIEQVISLSQDNHSVQSCQSLARDYFSLSNGVKTYNKLYNEVLRLDK
jgi:glycosyltransferase involved in cell wall biosynthesis